MTLHAPTHRAGLASHHWLRDILIVGVVAVLTIGAVWALSTVRFPATVATTEAQQLIEFRAAERAAMGVATTTGGTTIQVPAVNHHPGERVPGELTPR